MKKVYIVDDDRIIVDSISTILTQEGYETKAQFDDENVVENVSAYDADLIIMDVMFPENEGSGFEMARALKRSDTTKTIPILMLSAVNEKGSYAGTFTNRDKDDAWLPVQEFIEKPIAPKQLIEKVSLLTN